jgi:hypothetical protein
MPTITLTISHELLEALNSGEVVDLKATLRAKAKPKKSEPLTPELAALHTSVSEMIATVRPDWSIGRAWKVIKPIADTPENVLHTLSVALDWTKGLVYQPEWFVKDYAGWKQRGDEEDILELEEQRTRWRVGKRTL